MKYLQSYRGFSVQQSVQRPNLQDLIGRVFRNYLIAGSEIEHIIEIKNRLTRPFEAQSPGACVQSACVFGRICSVAVQFSPGTCVGDTRRYNVFCLFRLLDSAPSVVR